MNCVVLMGRLTRDPEVRYSQGERSMAVARYTLAVDRRGRKQQNGDQTSDFISCIAFGKAGEFAEKYFRQGMRILIRGRIQTGSYVNKDGQKVYTTDVIVEDQEFADSKSQGSGNNSSRSNSQNGGNYQRPLGQTQSNSTGDGFMNIPDGVEDEGLPFN